MSYTTIPSSATLAPRPFRIAIPEQDIKDFEQLIRLSKLAGETFESRDRKYGVMREWMVKAQDEWQIKFDWRKKEAEINEIPQWIVDVEDGHGHKHSIHFAGLFSRRTDARPLAFFHGWPGSFLEFLPILRLVKAQYPDPAQLPYNIIVPSLVGYAFSSAAPLNRDFGMEDCSAVMQKLLEGLGMKGYIAQGGDLGSFTARYLAVKDPNCDGALLNFCPLPTPPKFEMSSLAEDERIGLERAMKFRSEGSAYASFHATRPSTIGFALQSSPVALLAWIGEKFLDWSDDDPSIDEILTSVSLWYLTDTMARAVYPYRYVHTAKPRPAHGSEEFYIKKPFGFSWFPLELMPTPKSWIETSGDLTFFSKHSSGGHFAAMEEPNELWKDVEDFAAQVWGQETAGGKL